MTDQELQALVLATGLMPCDRLPKKDPDQELENFLVRVAVNINWAAGDGKLFIQFADSQTVAPVSKCLMVKAKEPLELLGYDVEIITALDSGSPELVTRSYMNISGWGD